MEACIESLFQGSDANECIPPDLMSEAAMLLGGGGGGWRDGNGGGGGGCCAPSPLSDASTTVMMSGSGSGGIELRVCTMTCSFKLSQAVDLRTLARSYPGGNVVYDPSSRAFHSNDGKCKKSFRNQATIQLRHRKHRVTGNIFCNGKVKLAGLRAEHECHEVAMRLVQGIASIGGGGSKKKWSASKSLLATIIGDEDEDEMSDEDEEGGEQRTMMHHSRRGAVPNPQDLSYSQMDVVLRKADAALGFAVNLDNVYMACIQRGLPDVKYEPRKYKAVRCAVPVSLSPSSSSSPPPDKKKKNKITTATVMIFENGKMACSGNVTDAQLRTAFEMVRSIVARECGRAEEDAISSNSGWTGMVGGGGGGAAEVAGAYPQPPLQQQHHQAPAVVVANSPAQYQYHQQQPTPPPPAPPAVDDGWLHSPNAHSNVGAAPSSFQEEANSNEAMVEQDGEDMVDDGWFVGDVALQQEQQERGWLVAALDQQQQQQQEEEENVWQFQHGVEQGRDEDLFQEQQQDGQQAAAAQGVAAAGVGEVAAIGAVAAVLQDGDGAIIVDNNNNVNHDNAGAEADVRLARQHNDGLVDGGDAMEMVDVVDDVQQVVQEGGDNNNLVVAANLHNHVRNNEPHIANIPGLLLQQQEVQEGGFGAFAVAALPYQYQGEEQRQHNEDAVRGEGGARIAPPAPFADNQQQIQQQIQQQQHHQGQQQQQIQQQQQQQQEQEEEASSSTSSSASSFQKDHSLQRAAVFVSCVLMTAVLSALAHASLLNTAATITHSTRTASHHHLHQRHHNPILSSPTTSCLVESIC